MLSCCQAVRDGNDMQAVAPRCERGVAQECPACRIELWQGFSALPPELGEVTPGRRRVEGRGIALRRQKQASFKKGVPGNVVTRCVCVIGANLS